MSYNSWLFVGRVLPVPGFWEFSTGLAPCASLGLAASFMPIVACWPGSRR